MSTENAAMTAAEVDAQQVAKKPRLALDEHANDMKNAGFSLSAIEEMKTRVNEELNENLDQQLRQFQVLDEVNGTDDDDDDDEDVDNNGVAGEAFGEGSENGSKYQDGNEDEDEMASDMDLDLDEIENLLDENLPDDLKERNKKRKYDSMSKTVMEEKRQNHFEVLPEGWVQVTHNSGMPLFLHKQSRVCSASRPYFLGAGSVRKHAVPLGAVPCLDYRRALEEEAMEREQMEAAAKMEAQPTQSNQEENANSTAAPAAASGCPFQNQQQQQQQSAQISSSTTSTTNGTATNDTSATAAAATATAAPLLKPNQKMPTAKILTVAENAQKESLTPQQLNEYCRKLFKFKEIRVLRFRSWNARRKFTKNRKNIQNLERPTLPDGTKLIKFPIMPAGGDANPNLPRRKDWIMNPNGKSFVCILHEYVQHALKKQPNYEFKELENAATPYAATVSINDLKYGTGYGTSKKQAKAEAARETLEILIPEWKDKISVVTQDKTVAKNTQTDLSVFDDIKIEDPRVAEFCNKATEPSPYAILQTCLQRNFGLGDAQISYEISRTRNKRNEFTMTVGKHTAKVLCKNKREGKQLASQAILQILHPHIKTWGSLLRLYGNNSIKTFKEKKLEEQEITVLQSKAAINQPNYAILEKLRSEMLKLAEKNKAVQSMGTFVPSSDLPISSGSNLNNLDI